MRTRKQFLQTAAGARWPTASPFEIASGALPVRLRIQTNQLKIAARHAMRG